MFRLAAPTLRPWCCSRPFTTTQVLPAGHNKWSKIKDKKGANDALRGRVLSRFARDIAVAIRSGGSADPNLNVQLATVIRKAKDQDVPKDNIERAIERAHGKNKKGEVVTYEALAFHSVGIIIESLSDNLNRTIGNLREIFNDHDVQKASVMWMFKKVGCVDVKFPKPEGSSATEEQDKVLDLAMANDMEDFDVVESDEEGKQIMKLYCSPEHVAKLADAVSVHPSAEIQERKIIYVSENPSDTPLEGEVQEKLTRLLDTLWADEDTLNIWTTADKL